MSSLQGLRHDVRAEQSGLFNWKKKKVSSEAISWTHKFVCLSSTSAERVPTSQLERLVLEEAGLGEKTVTVPDITCSPEEFHLLLLTTYPKLDSGGGFELLRCKPQSRDLLLIGPRISNSPRLLKRQVGNGKVYMRPIQRDLSLEEVTSDEVEGVGSPPSNDCMYSMILLCKVEERCLDCGKRYKVAVLRKHMKECPGGPSVARSRSPIRDVSGSS